MDERNEVVASSAIVLSELSKAAEAHFEATGMTQSAIWYSGYLAGRLASASGGMAIYTRESPFVVEMFDFSEVDMPDNMR